MGELLLCGQELASVPYYIENALLNVYSLEELCYYLQNNTDLVEPSFMDAELISWIRTELKLTALSEQLTKIMEEGGGLSVFVAALAAGCNYCSREEVAVMQEKLAAFENKSEIECRKIRADRFLEKKRYKTCILEYKRLLELPEVTGMFEGDIYHNLGTAYAGLFLFRDAADCYKMAYEKNRNPLSKQQGQTALHLAEGIVPQMIKAEKAEFQMPEQTLKQWKETYQRNSK